MESVKLELSFQDGADKTFKLSIEDPKDDLDEIQIQEAMTNIIDSNIFDSKGEDLMDSKGARIITTSIEELVF